MIADELVQLSRDINFKINPFFNNLAHFQKKKQDRKLFLFLFLKIQSVQWGYARQAFMCIWGIRAWWPIVGHLSLEHGKKGICTKGQLGMECRHQLWQEVWPGTGYRNSRRIRRASVRGQSQQQPCKRCWNRSRMGRVSVQGQGHWETVTEGD